MQHNSYISKVTIYLESITKKEIYDLHIMPCPIKLICCFTYIPNPVHSPSILMNLWTDKDYYNNLLVKNECLNTRMGEQINKHTIVSIS